MSKEASKSVAESIAESQSRIDSLKAQITTAETAHAALVKDVGPNPVPDSGGAAKLRQSETAINLLRGSLAESEKTLMSMKAHARYTAKKPYLVLFPETDQISVMTGKSLTEVETALNGKVDTRAQRELLISLFADDKTMLDSALAKLDAQNEARKSMIPFGIFALVGGTMYDSFSEGIDADLNVVSINVKRDVPAEVKQSDVPTATAIDKKSGK